MILYGCGTPRHYFDYLQVRFFWQPNNSLRSNYISIFIYGDSLQTISRQSSEPYDFMRTLRMAGYGMLILGPSLHFWFNFMSKVLPQRDLITTLKKICLGQTTFGPFMTAIFFSANAAVQGIQDSVYYTFVFVFSFFLIEFVLYILQCQCCLLCSHF